jgi:hypothetical protein
MGRPKLKNPRRKRRVAYFTDDEEKMLDALLAIHFFSLETDSDRTRAALLEWAATQKKDS